MIATLFKFTKWPLHWQILLGLILGALFGFASFTMGWGDFSKAWVSPWGQIFVRLLKLIAVPLVFGSLLTGVASLSDLQKLSRIGGKTIGIYMTTTFFALVIGLCVVNFLQPGLSVPEASRLKLQAAYQSSVDDKVAKVQGVTQRGPLQPLVDMVPANIIGASSNNRAMLQIVFFCILFGVGIVQVSKSVSQPIVDFFEAVNQVTIKMVDIIMLMAPLGVFALISDTFLIFEGESQQEIVSLLSSLIYYSFTVVLGLGIHSFLFLPLVLVLFSKMPLKHFFLKMIPVQLLAFSTSSSGATLPLTMETAENELGISEEVSSFVLPLGATINMDGTGLYQAVAAVFISQAVGIDLGFSAQASIVFTALLASIGTAAVPGAGIIMLIVILESVGVPSSGIALILGVDRILDMLRTTTNVTGDAVVASVIASSEGQLKHQGS